MFTRILVPLDESSLAEQAVGAAAAIARASRGEIGLILARDAEPYAGLPNGRTPNAADPEASIYLRALRDELAEETSLPVNAAVEHGRPADVICRRARELGSDVIVMTSHGRTGLSRAWMGSVADAVVRESSVPVLMLRADESTDWRAGERHLFRRILLPMDGSPQSEAILDAATSVAHCGSAVLVLLRVVAPVPLYIYDPVLPSYPSAIPDEDSTNLLLEEARVSLAELAQRLESSSGLSVETQVVLDDHAAQAILDTAVEKKADLIAMTTHGRGASRLIVGSVTDKVLRGSHLPLLLFHPHPVVTPSEAPVKAQGGMSVPLKAAMMPG